MISSFTLITTTSKHVQCALHHFVITKPLSGDFFVQQPRLVLVQSQSFNDSLVMHKITNLLHYSFEGGILAQILLLTNLTS